MSDDLKPLKDVIEADIARFKCEFNNPPPVKFAYGDGSGERRTIEVPADEVHRFGKSAIESLLPMQIDLEELRLSLLRRF